MTDRGGRDCHVFAPRHLVTLSPCHLVTLSPCHLVTLSPCHLVTLSPCHLVTLSPCHLVTPSPRHRSRHCSPSETSVVSFPSSRRQAHPQPVPRPARPSPPHPPSIGCPSFPYATS